MQPAIDFKQVIERKLHFSIGAILLLNLYLLTGIFKMPYLPVLIFCLVVATFFLINRFDRSVFFSLVNNWNTLFYILFSLFFMLIQLASAENQLEFKFNDSIRIVIYTIYFSWTAFLYQGKANFTSFIFQLSLVCFLILLVEGIIEMLDPFLFALMLSENVSKTMLRLGGTFADANAYSNAVVIFGFMVFKFMPNMPNNRKVGLFFFVFVTMLYLVELSGSRQGILLLIVLCVYFLPNFIRKIGLRKMLIVLFALLLLLLTLSPFIYQYLLQNPDSSLARVLFDSENPKSINSDLERSSAMIAGLTYIKNHFYLYGTGMFLFENEWSNYVQVKIPYPHNSFVYLFCQYGIGALLFFYFLWISTKRAFSQHLWPLMLMLFIQLFLLPNPVYYPIHYFTLFVIDLCWLNKDQNVIIETNTYI
jgi:hypothetical protein